MAQEDIIKYMIIGISVVFVLIVVAYLILRKKMQTDDYKRIQQLKQGTDKNKFGMEILYQKLYVALCKTPFLKRYVLKLRRRLEIINIEDEYLTRKQTASIMLKALPIILLLTIAIIVITKNNTLLMCTLLLFELVFIEAIIEGMVDKLDNKILKQQVDLFAEIRHAYHEYNMVEEAIYEVAQDDELEISRQAEKIYEILISSDPENELEKYYDIAPNSYLKEFAGISYLTKEFGDRKSDEGSLYLKNLNNITQEMQLEILKRDKLDYVFQSLSIISAVPILFIEIVKNWAVSQFSFTDSFYSGKGGLIVQMLLILITFASYVLIRKLKDNGSTTNGKTSSDNPWQAKLYKKRIVKDLVDLFIPKKGTKENRKVTKLLKEAASKQKMEWLYINRICACVVAFVASIALFMQIHKIAIDYIYENPTTESIILGELSATDKVKAMDLTKQDNYFLDKLKNKTSITKERNIELAKSRLRIEIKNSPYYVDATDDAIDTATERIYDKLKVVANEDFKWFELLLAFVFAIIGYYIPIWVLMFQKAMRKLEMENEVMQFQTIILMLMKIERVNVEIILEWLERYSNIYREPISKCVNNYEAGAWEALEELKNDVTNQQLIRLVESMQAAVEKIPISEAFDELDSERHYYQEKRKEANERLIARKGLIGKAIGFAPMICLFVGYLIIPLVVVGLTQMTTTFSTMSTMM